MPCKRLFILRDAALWARGEVIGRFIPGKKSFRLDDIAIFNSKPDAKDRIPLFPWESLMFGRGTALERAWVFILMARQEGLRCSALGRGRSGRKHSNRPWNQALQPWCVAVLIDNNAYLFDPLLGMPIPGKDGIKT